MLGQQDHLVAGTGVESRCLAGIPSDSAGVIAPPPVLFVAAWTTAAALHHIVPFTLTRRTGAHRQVVGAVMVAAGACLSAMVVRRFAHASTPVSPMRPTRALVIDGPYRYSRNPDYVGQTLIYAGSAILSNKAWPIVVLPVTLALVKYGVIAREERYLSARFGEAYRRYAGRVPRWL
jgi:protein-S-isoprenylcysteine O-methyltransferase Ste14